MVEARAAGIPMKLMISFEASDISQTEFQDKITIMSEDYVVVLPMYAYAP